jgi:REP element-mobilizing transposase RayT
VVHAERWRTVNERLLHAVRDMVRKVCVKHHWRLYGCGIVADHLHLASGANSQDVVEDVCLRLMNGLAFVHDMKPVYCHSAYVATFGEYDQRALRS